MNTQAHAMPHQPCIHITDNNDGTMTARAMYEPESVPFTFKSGSYLTTAERYLSSRWPLSNYKKTGWSANSTQAIFHFSEV